MTLLDRLRKEEMVPKLIFENKVLSGEEFQQALAQAMSNTNPVDDLLELSNELRGFEQKYGMSSTEFHEAYQAGSLNDELQHCIEWVATYEFFLKTKRQLEMALMRAAVQPALSEFTL